MIILKGEHSAEYAVNPSAVTFVEHDTATGYSTWSRVRFMDGKSISVRGSVREVMGMLESDNLPTD